MNRLGGILWSSRSTFWPCAVPRNGRDAGSAAAGRDDAWRAGFRGRWAAPCVGPHRFLADGGQRGVTLLCHSGENLSEHFLSHQGRDADLVRRKCVDFLLDRVSQSVRMGSGSRAAKESQSGDRPVTSIMVGYCRSGANDRLQLVRLNVAAAFLSVVRELGGGGSDTRIELAVSRNRVLPPSRVSRDRRSYPGGRPASVWIRIAPPACGAKWP